MLRAKDCVERTKVTRRTAEDSICEHREDLTVGAVQVQRAVGSSGRASEGLSRAVMAMGRGARSCSNEYAGFIFGGGGVTRVEVTRDHHTYSRVGWAVRESVVVYGMTAGGMLTVDLPRAWLGG